MQIVILNYFYNMDHYLDLLKYVHLSNSTILLNLIHNSLMF
nr:MAG TPA: hypothetical protein [Bacteriophage sp.]